MKVEHQISMSVIHQFSHEQTNDATAPNAPVGLSSCDRCHFHIGDRRDISVRIRNIFRDVPFRLHQGAGEPNVYTEIRGLPPRLAGVTHLVLHRLHFLHRGLAGLVPGSSVPLDSWQASVQMKASGVTNTLGTHAVLRLPIPPRRKCLLFNNLVAIVGAVLMLLSQRAMSFEMIMAGRFLYGINAGISLSAHALYTIECTPKILQGMVGVTIATFIAMGKFVGQLLGLSELLGTEDRWPWLLGFSGFTALFQLVSLPFLPESPKFLLLNQGDQRACEKALTRLWGNKDHSVEVEEMLEEKVTLQNTRSRSVMELFRERSIRWQLITIIVTFLSLQLSGINAVYFYSQEVFRAAGIHEDQLRYATLGTGMCEMMSSLVCFVIIERTGKKVLVFTGYMAMTVALILLTITLHLQHYIPWTSYCSMVLIFIFLFSFSIGPGGVVAPLPGVIFTQAFKASAYTVGCTINWIGMFIVGMVFPILVENLDSFSFVIFLLVCLTTGLYVYFNVPEMKNKTALEIAVDFDQMRSKSGRWKGKKKDELPPDVRTTSQTKF